MRYRLLEIAIPCLLACFAIGTITYLSWLRFPPPEEVVAIIRTADLDGIPEGTLRADQLVDEAPLETPVPGQPTPGDGQPSTIAGHWPWFRGATLDAIAHDTIPLLRGWSDDGPKKLWQVEMGKGFAGAAIERGRVYVLDYDEELRADTMRCLSLEDGREIWRNSYPVPVAESHGMSRTVAAIADRYVVSLGPKCHVACWDAETGENLWLIDLVRDHGSRVPAWYAGQCPLIDPVMDQLILAPGGQSLMMAVDYRTGEILWESENPDGWDMTHVSVVPMDLGSRRTYVYCGKGGVAAVDAETGATLWETTDWRIAVATCPSPVVLPDNRIFLSDLYGIRQHDRRFICMTLEGEEVWNSGRVRFGIGPYMIADGLIYIMDDSGVLTTAEATPTAYTEIDTAEIFEDGVASWGPMALVGGRLLLRDSTRMACLDLAAIDPPRQENTDFPPAQNEASNPPVNVFEPPQSDVPALPPGNVFEPPQEDVPALPPGNVFEPPQEDVPALPPSNVFESPQDDVPALPPGNVFEQ